MKPWTPAQRRINHERAVIANPTVRATGFRLLTSEEWDRWIDFLDVSRVVAQQRGEL